MYFAIALLQAVQLTATSVCTFSSISVDFKSLSTLPTAIFTKHSDSPLLVLFLLKPGSSYHCMTVAVWGVELGCGCAGDVRDDRADLLL